MPEVAETDSKVFACADSTLRLPKPGDGLDYPEYRLQRDARFEDPAGKCEHAKSILKGGSPTYEDLIERCPETMNRLHAGGAPQEINCVIALMGFCRSNPVAGE